jgi:hypothetical protein
LTSRRYLPSAISSCGERGSVWIVCKPGALGKPLTVVVVWALSEFVCGWPDNSDNYL